MTESNEMTQSKAAETASRHEQEQAMRPAVDIFEDKTGITVQADMPGVTRERLEIQIDRDTLAIEGKAEIPMPEGLEAIYADVRSTRYQRSFTLSHELDGEKADAAFKDGVLTLRIPKREQYQPRKIKVNIS
ncbi:MAG: Hsp20/alpha crystallin family protein [Candidatus Thiodiazotropha sp.]